MRIVPSRPITSGTWIGWTPRDALPSRWASHPLSLSGFLRIVTHPKVFREPTPVPQALAFVDVLRQAPNHLEVRPGSRHWELFSDLCRTASACGNLIPDAYLAAMAIERDPERRRLGTDTVGRGLNPLAASHSVFATADG